MSRGTSALAAAVLAAGLFGLSAAPASAQERGFYLDGAFGLSAPQDSEVEAGGASADVDVHTGFAGSVAAGHAYGNGVRTELELGLHDNELGEGGGVETNGDLQAWSLMFNALYDFDLGGPLMPFVGAGVGGARVSLDADNHPNVTGSVDDSDAALAYQAMAGVAYDIAERWKATLRYRYFAVPDLGYGTSTGAGFDTEYHSHDVMVGLRFSFGGPEKKMMAEPEPAPAAAPAPPPEPPMQKAEPAPPPPPEPQVARNYLVFFDFDSSALTSEARAVIRSAADAAEQLGSVRIALTGHADRSGPRAYNQRLSMRRAVAVREELMRLGIARGEIGVRASGETEPLVPTADGVREPQNRRVEIVLQ